MRTGRLHCLINSKVVMNEEVPCTSARIAYKRRVTFVSSQYQMSYSVPGHTQLKVKLKNSSVVTTRVVAARSHWRIHICNDHCVCELSQSLITLPKLSVINSTCSTRIRCIKSTMSRLCENIPMRLFKRAVGSSGSGRSG